jgi:hypothetical protein
MQVCAEGFSAPGLGTDSAKVFIHTISGFRGSDKRQPDLIMNGGAQTLDGARRA